MSAEATPDHARSLRHFVAFLVARAVFGLVLLATTFRRIPIPWYYPLRREWAWETAPRGLGMAWYGATALALVAAAMSAGLVLLAHGVPSIARALGRRRTVLAISRAGALMILVDLAYFGWTTTHQTPAPLPAECAR